MYIRHLRVLSVIINNYGLLYQLSRVCLCLFNEFIQKIFFFSLLRLNVPVNNFSVMSGQNHRFLGIIGTFRGVNVSLLKNTTWRR